MQSWRWLSAGLQAVMVGTIITVACLNMSAASSGTGVDLAGKPVDPLHANPGKPVVLIFVRTDCPISNRYAPTIQRHQCAVCRQGCVLAGVSRQVGVQRGDRAASARLRIQASGAARSAAFAGQAGPGASHARSCGLRRQRPACVSRAHRQLVRRALAMRAPRPPHTNWTMPSRPF